MRTTTPHRFRSRLQRRLRLRRTDDGATLVIGALLMVVLVGFVGFAVDVGLLYNERRQEQSAVDTAVLSGAREVLLEGGTDQDVFDEVTRLSHENMDNPPSLAAWRAAFTTCTDPDRVAAGFTVPLAPASGAVDCISFNADRSELRVKLPTTSLDTIFASVLGLTSWDVSAFAEAGLAEGDGYQNILPFPLPAVGAASTTVCIVADPSGSICAAPHTGNFGYLEIPRPTMTSENLSRRCNGGREPVFAENAAQGIDHFIEERPGTGTPGGTENVDYTLSGTQVPLSDKLVYCGAVANGERPNHVWQSTGTNLQTAAEVGLFTGTMFSDGEPARFQRGPYEKKPLSIRGTAYQIDDRPLHEFIEPTLDFGVDVPATCDPDYIAGYPLLTLTASMQKCLDDLEAWTDPAPLFTRDSDGDGNFDFLASPRFAWLPMAWPDLTACSGGNCDYEIHSFRPVFIGASYWEKNNGTNYRVSPGETFPTVGNGASLRGMEVIVISNKALPPEVVDEGPTAGQTDFVEIALTR